MRAIGIMCIVEFHDNTPHLATEKGGIFTGILDSTTVKATVISAGNKCKYIKEGDNVQFDSSKLDTQRLQDVAIYRVREDQIDLTWEGDFCLETQ